MVEVPQQYTSIGPEAALREPICTRCKTQSADSNSHVRALSTEAAGHVGLRGFIVKGYISVAYRFGI